MLNNLEQLDREFREDARKRWTDLVTALSRWGDEVAGIKNERDALQAENARLRNLLARTRAVLNTAIGEDATDLDKPERESVLLARIEAELAVYEANGIERSRGLNMLAWIYGADTWNEHWTDDCKRLLIVKAMIE